MQILRNQTKGRVLNDGIGKQCRQKFHHCANTTRRALQLKGLSSGLEKKSLQKFPLTINPCRVKNIAKIMFFVTNYEILRSINKITTCFKPGTSYYWK
jgi:hypothetical protein